MSLEWGIDIAVVGSGLINDKASIAENLAEINSALALIGPSARAFKSQQPEQPIDGHEQGVEEVLKVVPGATVEVNDLHGVGTIFM